MCEEQEFRPDRIFFMRHAESEWNKVGNEMKREGRPPPRMDGVPDHKTPLTERGEEQARQTAIAFLENYGTPDIIYHSPYLRTTQTAKIIEQTMRERGSPPIPLHRDLLLGEQQFGRLDAGVVNAVGMSHEEFQTLQREFQARRKQVGKFYARPPDGQSWYDVTLNGHSMLVKFFRPRWHKKTLLVISHSVTIATYLYLLQGREEQATVEYYEGNKLENCGIVHFRHNPTSEFHWDLVEWNKILWQEPLILKEPS